MQNRISPEISDLCLMRMPRICRVGDAFGKHWAKGWVVADAFVELGDYPFNIGAANINARW